MGLWVAKKNAWPVPCDCKVDHTHEIGHGVEVKKMSLLAGYRSHKR